MKCSNLNINTLVGINSVFQVTARFLILIIGQLLNTCTLTLQNPGMYAKILYFHDPYYCGTNIYSYDGTEDVTIATEPATSWRTKVINSMQFAMSMLLMATSILMLRRRASRGPLLTVAAAMTIADFGGVFMCLGDTLHTKTLSDLLAYVGATPTEVSGTGSTAAWLMAALHAVLLSPTVALMTALLRHGTTAKLSFDIPQIVVQSPSGATYRTSSPSNAGDPESKKIKSPSAISTATYVVDNTSRRRTSNEIKSPSAMSTATYVVDNTSRRRTSNEPKSLLVGSRILDPPTPCGRRESLPQDATFVMTEDEFNNPVPVEEPKPEPEPEAEASSYRTALAILGEQWRRRQRRNALVLDAMELTSFKCEPPIDQHE